MIPGMMLCFLMAVKGVTCKMTIWQWYNAGKHMIYSVFPVFVVSVLFSTVAAERPQVREAAPSECPSEQRLRPVEQITFLDQSMASSLQPEFAGVVTTVQRVAQLCEKENALALPNSFSSQGIAL